MQKGVACRFLPEEISNFATTVALPQIELSSSRAIGMFTTGRRNTSVKSPQLAIRWHGEAWRLSGLEVDNQFEFGRPLDWQIG